MGIEEKDPVAGLLELMARLRNPETGCPWDIEQDFTTIVPYTIEEAYEVADAVGRGDMNDLKDELGDLLLQIAFHSQIAKEKGLFVFDDVARSVTQKMIHRHPHVFGDEIAVGAKDVEKRIWEDRKAQEPKKRDMESALDDVPLALPSVARAQKLQNRAARTGFEWAEAIDVLDKMEEEIIELREALRGGRQDEIVDELGDVFFVLVNFGRMLGVNCEESIRHANAKFERRFRGMEKTFKELGESIEAATADRREELWQEQKRKEREKALSSS